MSSVLILAQNVLSHHLIKFLVDLHKYLDYVIMQMVLSYRLVKQQFLLHQQQTLDHLVKHQTMMYSLLSQVVTAQMEMVLLDLMPQTLQLKVIQYGIVETMVHHLSQTPITQLVILRTLVQLEIQLHVEMDLVT